MLLDLDFVFHDLDGNANTNQNAGKLVASLLATKPEGVDVAKASLWFPELHKNGKIELDKVDLESLEKFLKRQAEIPQQGITVLAWSQLQAAIDKARQV